MDRLKNCKSIAKHWIAKIFKIPQIHYVTYQKDGQKILAICGLNAKGEKTEQKFLVKHLLKENLEVTEQTLQKENKMFADVSRFSSNK